VKSGIEGSICGAGGAATPKCRYLVYSPSGIGVPDDGFTDLLDDDVTNNRTRGNRKEYLFRWRDSMEADARIGAVTHHVLFRLSADADTHTGGNCRPGITKLARNVRRSQRTVYRHLAIGKKLGYIAIDLPGHGGRNGKGFATVYRLTIPETPATADTHLGDGQNKTRVTSAETTAKVDETTVRGGTPPLLTALLPSHRESHSQSPERDQPGNAFTSERRRPSAVEGRPDHGRPVDELKRRCLEHFTVKGVAYDDCLRVVDQLRAADIADHLIDSALGKAIDADAKSLKYFVKVTEDWYAQRTGVAR